MVVYFVNLIEVNAFSFVIGDLESIFMVHLDDALLFFLSIVAIFLEP